MMATSYRWSVDPKTDMLRLIGLLRTMHSELGIAQLNDEKLQATIVNLMANGFIIVTEIDDIIVGSIAVMAGTPYWYSDDVFLFDRWLYVHPAYRKSRHFQAMFKRIIQVAKRPGMPPLLMAITDRNTTQLDRKRRVMSRYLRPLAMQFISEER